MTDEVFMKACMNCSLRSLNASTAHCLRPREMSHGHLPVVSSGPNAGWRPVPVTAAGPLASWPTAAVPDERWWSICRAGLRSSLRLLQLVTHFCTLASEKERHSPR